MTLLAPGLWLQRLTTREPTDDQVEVSIRALRSVLDREAAETPEQRRLESRVDMLGAPRRSPPSALQHIHAFVLVAPYACISGLPYASPRSPHTPTRR